MYLDYFEKIPENWGNDIDLILYYPENWGNDPS